jgi:hypothetical protein
LIHFLPGRHRLTVWCDQLGRRVSSAAPPNAFELYKILIF